jgi:hypothetical protein
MTSVVRMRGLIGGCLVALVVLTSPGVLVAQDSEYTREQLQELYMEYLKEEGYLPMIDQDGDVAFKAEGRNYFIQVNETDPEFFRLAFPNFWEIESEEERVRAFAAASQASFETKVAKVYLVNDNTWASTEIFVAKPEDFKPLFKRSLSALKVSVDTFAEAMRAEQ